MVLNHVWGLFAHPTEEWKDIRGERCSVTKCYCSHVLFLAAIPAVAGFIGTSMVGWQVGQHEVNRLTTESALSIAALFYIGMLVAVFAVGKTIHWMGQTYGTVQPLPQCIALAAYTATPLFLIGIMLLYPILWLNLIIGLPALAYTVYLLYIGLPIMMDIPSEKGFLFASAVLAVGLIMLVAVMIASVILWSAGFGPVLNG